MALCLLAVLFARSSLKSQTLGSLHELPFTLSLQEVTQDELPGLHSFAFARSGEWWVIVGGRIGGLHGFFPVTGFPTDEANMFIRLINPETGEERKYEVESLTIPFKDALKSTNPQYAQDGNTLYIAGGYGKDFTQNKFVTFPVLTAIDLPLLISKIAAGNNPSVAIRQLENNSMQVCGGEMDKMGDWFCLVGGHEFSGLYAQNTTTTFTQAYTNELRRFKIQKMPSLKILEYSATKDEVNLHRRDFSLAPAIQPDGTEKLILYGGVFRPNADLPFYNPVHITPNGAYQTDIGYEQLFSQYNCPIVPLFDSLNGAMYSIFFAGLSAHYWEESTRSVKYDEKVPFIKDITTFRRLADGSSREYLMPQRFDQFLGTNMIFVLAETAPHYKNEVLKLRAMNGPTFAGWLFGGIKAEIPNLTPSSANRRMFKVYITPKSTTSTANSATENIDFKIIPNPTEQGQSVWLKITGKANTVRILNTNGQVLISAPIDREADSQHFAHQMEQLPRGVYFVEMAGKMNRKILKWVMM